MDTYCRKLSATLPAAAEEKNIFSPPPPKTFFREILPTQPGSRIVEIANWGYNLNLP